MESNVNYNIGTPQLVYTLHIIISLFLFYVGYSLDIKKSYKPWMGKILMLLGVVALSYHIYLLYFKK